MTGPRRTSDAGKAKIADALTRGRPASQRSNPATRVGVRALLALQRDVGNDAVRALLAGKLRFPEERARGDMDAALVELRKDEPAVDTVETGLKAAQSVGIPVELEGPKPPPSALSVTKSGFGPGSVPAKKPPPPAKPVPAKNRLGKAAARPPGPRGGGRNRGGAPGMPSFNGAAPTAVTPGPLSGDQLTQPPVPPAHTRPEEDPAFTHVTGAVVGFARSKKAHPPAATKATEAQDAALAPSDDLDSQAKTAKADTMDAQPVGTFDKKAFIAAVNDAVEAKSPKTLKEADNYKESGKAAEVKDDVKGMVTSGKQGESKDIETATAAPPDQSKAVPKPVTPLSTEDPGHAVDVPAGGAAPKPAPPDQLNLEAGKHQTDQEMADGGVTEEQLQDSNEPDFQQAVTDKHAAAAHADTAPGEYRQHEQGVLDQSKSAASASTAEAVAGMQGSKAAALAGLVADKGKTKSKDEAKRAEVSTRIQAIFAAAESDVKQILDGIDPKVDKEFTEGEADARAAFENYVAVKMAAYKEDRYSGWLGGLRWAKDKLLGMPDKVNEFFDAGRELYLKKMDGVISRIADIVGNDLNAAKRRIASGKAEIATYVKSLPRDLKKVGAEATQEIGERFQQLEADVEDKQKSVVDTLATKYTEARKGLDDRIEELQAENKGLVDKAISAIKAVVGTIRDLARMLFDVLARVADVVGQIIKHPIRFLENLVAGVKGGIQKFKDTIVEHLRKGLMAWLFGELADSGIEIPEHFDLKSIVKFIASIFGLTWTNIRNRIVRRIGEPAMSAVEKGVEIFQLLASQGVAGLWQMLVDKLGDIKEMILEQVKDFVVTRIISAGISYLISLLNPAAAFIKACKMIYEIVMFFVNNGKRIIDLVNAIIDSVADMVRGNVGAVVDKIDDVLGRMVPIIIGFLASLLNLSGIGEKIREIVNMLRKPVTKAIDFLVDTGLKLAGPIIRGVAGISRKVKAKIAAGKAWVKGKVEAGKARVRNLAAFLPGPLRFFAAGESHRLWIERTGAGRLMVASTPEVVEQIVRAYAQEIEAFPPVSLSERRRAELRTNVGNVVWKLGEVDRLKKSAEGGDATSTRKLERAEESVARNLAPIFSEVHRVRMAMATVPPYTTPAGGKSRGSVRCAASFLVECAPGQQPNPGAAGHLPAVTAGPARSTRGRYRRDVHEMVLPEHATGQPGGFVAAAAPATTQAERRAQFVTRATGDEVPSAHAEARLLEYVKQACEADPVWKSRVRSIEINITHSPCPSCTGQLLALHQLLANERLRFAIVQYGEWYEGTYPTTAQSIGELRSAYHVDGPPRRP